MAERKRIRRIKPELLAAKIGEEEAADVCRALGKAPGEVYFAEPSIVELGEMVKAQVRAQVDPQTDDALNFIPMVLSSVLKDENGKRVFKKEALDEQPASVFAELIRVASHFVADRVREVFELSEDEEDPKAQAPKGEAENSTK